MEPHLTYELKPAHPRKPEHKEMERDRGRTRWRGREEKRKRERERARARATEREREREREKHVWRAGRAVGMEQDVTPRAHGGKTQTHEKERKDERFKVSRL